MDRRTFLRTMGSAAAVAATGSLGTRAEASLPGRMTIAAVGDCIPARRVSERRDRPFLDLVELLRSADCTWGNCETVFFDDGARSAGGAAPIAPAAKELDPHSSCPPWGADELAWLGIDFVGTANNHILDWGDEGLVSTLGHLDRVGIAHGGSGMDLARAAAPAFCDTRAGRVGQVNCASSFNEYFAAGEAGARVAGRPGLNPLHVDWIVEVDQELFERLDAVQWEVVRLAGLGTFEDLIEEMNRRLPEGTAVIGEALFRVGEATDLIGVAKQEDLDRLARAVEEARRSSRVVLATLHGHEARETLERPAPFIEQYARSMVDAGADIFFAAGPHVLRGIEIYKGRPIFYSLSNFLFQYESIHRIPAPSMRELGLDPATADAADLAAKIPFPLEERFWWSVVPKITVDKGWGWPGDDEGAGPEIVEVELYPVTLGFGEPIWRRGTAELASGEKAKEILGELARLSEPYGTEIEIEDGVGRLRGL